MHDNGYSVTKTGAALRLQARHCHTGIVQDCQERHVRGNFVEANGIDSLPERVKILWPRLADTDSGAVVGCADELNAGGFKTGTER
jgi:hypothetical protein